MPASRRTGRRIALEGERKEGSLLRGNALLELIAVLLRSLLEERLPVMTRRSMNTFLST
jgi:hypothetical protein